MRCRSLLPMLAIVALSSVASAQTTTFYAAGGDVLFSPEIGSFPFELLLSVDNAAPSTLIDETGTTFSLGGAPFLPNNDASTDWYHLGPYAAGTTLQFSFVVQGMTFTRAGIPGFEQYVGPGVDFYTGDAPIAGGPRGFLFALSGVTNEVDNIGCTPDTYYPCRLGPTFLVTPEPASFALMSTGLVGVFGVVRRRRSR